MILMLWVFECGTWWNFRLVLVIILSDLLGVIWICVGCWFVGFGVIS